MAHEDASTTPLLDKIWNMIMYAKKTRGEFFMRGYQPTLLVGRDLHHILEDEIYRSDMIPPYQMLMSGSLSTPRADLRLFDCDLHWIRQPGRISVVFIVAEGEHVLGS